MTDAQRHVVLIARDSSLADKISSFSDSHSVVLKQQDSPEQWLADVAEQTPESNGAHSPVYADCVLYEASPGSLSDSPRLKQICELRRGLPVIVIAHQPTVREAVAAMRQGALTVIEHPCENGALTAAVEESLRQAHELKPQVLRAATASLRLEKLNEGEQAVLESLLEGRANKEIAHALEIGLRTVELRRSRIMKKMGASSVAQLVRLVCEARSLAA